MNLSTRSFLLNHKTIALTKSVIENAQAKVRNAQKKLFTAYREARYEVTFATTNPADYKEVRVVVSALMRHLGSMSLVVQYERLLMLGYPDRENDDLETESGDGQDSTISDNSSIGGNDSDDESDADTASTPELGSTSCKSTTSDRMAGGGRGGRGCTNKHRRGSAAELRRIRQLLMRAESRQTRSCRPANRRKLTKGGRETRTRKTLGTTFMSRLQLRRLQEEQKVALEADEVQALSRGFLGLDCRLALAGTLIP